MVVEKTAYWMAVGVLTLVVSNNLASRYGLNVDSLPDRSFVAVERVSGDASRLLGTAEVMLGQAGTRFAHSHTTMACFQTRLASVQSRIAQREVVLARIQAQRARMVAMQQLNGTALCSR